MKAVEVRHYGPPEVMSVVERPEPEAGPGEVVIHAEAVGVNFHDLWARLGFPGLAALPFVQGIEVAGTVVAAGADVAALPHLRPGARVIGLPLVDHGAYAERVKVPVDLVFAVPDQMPMETAAAFGMSFLTAYAALEFTARPRPAERVLIHSAAGGVGTAAVQLARRAGTEVFGTASRQKHPFLRELGVDHPIDYRAGDFAAEATALTGGEGVDVILDPIGGETSRRSLGILRYGGRLVCYGISEFARRSDRIESEATSSWETASFPAAGLLTGATSVMGSHLGAPPAMLHAWMTELMAWYAAGGIAPRIDRTFALSQAAAAHQYIHDRRNLGKVLLIP